MKLNLKVWPVFQNNYEAKKMIVVNRGGTSSSKTQSILRLILLWLSTWVIDNSGVTFPRGTLSIVRKYRANLIKSVLRDWDKILSEEYPEFLSLLKINRTELTYTYQNRTVEFFWIDDPQKARWPRREILYCNEANEITEEDFFQLFIRTSYKTFIDFNPDDEDVWINTELEQRRAIEVWDVDVIISTYKDNPFLSEKIVREIDLLETTNPKKYLIYGKGQYGKLEWLIFSFTEIQEIPENAKFLGHGLDFWYTNDPTACVSLYMYNQSLIVDERIYETRMNNNDISKRFSDLKFDRHDTIIADSSEPKSIDEIRLSGWNIRGAVKWPDSIAFGIDTLQGFPIFITRTSVNVQKEFKKYVWAVDKNGKRLNTPAWWDDHAIDALRYIATEKIRKKVDSYDISIW